MGKTWLEMVRALIQAKVGDDELVEQRYQELVETATGLFLEQGFHATTVPQIAGAMGMSVGGLYRYISRKEDILLLILAHIIWRFHEQVEPILTHYTNPEDKLRHALAAYVANIARDTGGALLAYRDMHILKGEAREALKKMELETNRVFATIIEEGIAQGVFRPCPSFVVAYNIIMLAHSWALKWWYWRDRMTLDDYIATQTELLLDGLRVRMDQEGRSG